MRDIARPRPTHAMLRAERAASFRHLVIDKECEVRRLRGIVGPAAAFRRKQVEMQVAVAHMAETVDPDAGRGERCLRFRDEISQPGQRDGNIVA